jgi:hypothetical protein
MRWLRELIPTHATWIRQWKKSTQLISNLQKLLTKVTAVFWKKVIVLSQTNAIRELWIWNELASGNWHRCCCKTNLHPMLKCNRRWNLLFWIWNSIRIRRGQTNPILRSTSTGKLSQRKLRYEKNPSFDVFSHIFSFSPQIEVPELNRNS